MTKKLLALSFVVLLATGVLAQPGVNVWIGGDFDGGPWNNVISTGIDKFVNVDVFIQMNNPGDLMGNIALPLGIDRSVLDTFHVASCGYVFPFSAWDVHQFVNLLDEFHPTFPTPPGFMTLTGNFIADTGGDPNPFFDSTVPSFGFWFNVHTVNDPALLETTVCDAMMFGWDPTQIANAGDENGNFYEVDWQFGCFYFSPNQPPEIGEFELPYECGYADFTVPFDVYDPDGDPLTVTSDYGTVTLVGQTPDELPDLGITFHYELDIDMEAFCGLCFSGPITITANDGNNDPVEFATDPITIVGEMTLSMDPALYIWPGMEEWMPIYLNTCADCFCLGGFTITICYGQAMGTAEVTDYMFGDALLGGEYSNIFFGDDFVRFVFINDLNNQQPAQDICAIDPEEPILWLKFQLAVQDYPADFCIPICFCDSDNPQEAFALNAISDKGGYATWFSHGCDDPPDSVAFGTLLLNLECGNIKVMDEHNVVYGDLNLNGYPNEVGDVVVYANYLTNPDPEWSLRQKFASDANRDGYQITIADLIFMINIINNVSGGGKVTPIDAVATVTMPANVQGDMNVMVNSDMSVGGALVTINHAGVELGVPTAQGRDLTYHDNGEVLTVAVYDMEANSYAPGANVLFTVPVLSQGELSFGDVQVADGRGALLDARTDISAPIPTEFTVSQNFPNPFNVKTSINFGLPTDASVVVSIYNVAGQLVQVMDLGHLAAGNHSANWDASAVASGVYFYKVAAGDFSQTQKMTLLK